MRILILWLALLSGCAQPRFGTPSAWLRAQEIAPGLSHWRAEPGLHALRVDLRQRRVLVTPHTERGQPLDAFSGAAAGLAAVNGSFFDAQFRARGHTVSEGQPWPEPLRPEASPLLACQVKGSGQRCELDLEPPFDLPPATHTALAGTPWLLRAGRARTAADDQDCAAFCAAPHPRTALGLSADGQTLILLLAEGRRDGVPGLTLADTARQLQALGAHDGLNLDGGGSSSLLLRGVAVMKRPAREPALRRIANALLIQ